MNIQKLEAGRYDLIATSVYTANVVPSLVTLTFFLCRVKTITNTVVPTKSLWKRCKRLQFYVAASFVYIQKEKKT